MNATLRAASRACGFASVVVGLVGLVACSGAGGRANGGAPVVAQSPAVPFGEWETAWLGELGATDPRLAMRMPEKPSADAVRKVAGAAVVRGGDDIGIVGGALDVFSFGERERLLHLLGNELVSQHDDGAGASAPAREERTLLSRLLDGEELRVARERLSPDAGSERVRAIVATWGNVSRGREVAEREALIQRGLLEIVSDVATGALERPRVLELEDALDALERLAVAEGYPDATKLITSLRVELGKAHPRVAPRPPPASVSLDVQLHTYLGVHEDRQTLMGRLEDEEASLRSDAKSRLAALSDAVQRGALEAAATHVGEETACAASDEALRASRARTLRPPPERALVCQALQVAAASATASEAMATVVLHDDVAIALWALTLDSGATDLDATRTAHALLASVPADRQDRLVRAALVSPVRAIAPGLATALVDAEGPGERHERATRWLAYGDAPFDLVAARIAR